MNFHPPIESRDTDELIVMSKGTLDEYQIEAVDLAVQELRARGMTQKEIEHRYDELFDLHQAQIHDEFAGRAEMDFVLLEKFLILLFWPKYLFSGWYLRRDGFLKMASHRMQLIALGVVFYIIAILTSVY